MKVGKDNLKIPLIFTTVFVTFSYVYFLITISFYFLIYILIISLPRYFNVFFVLNNFLCILSFILMSTTMELPSRMPPLQHMESL